MNLTHLKKMPAAELVALAQSMNIEGAARSRKQDIIFSILKQAAKNGDEISGEYAGRLKIAKLNIDENPQTPPKYGIRGIPTLMLFKGGNVEATKVGALSKSQLVAFLDSQV